MRLINPNHSMSSNKRLVIKTLLIIGLITCTTFLMIIIKDATNYKQIFNILNLVTFYLPGVLGCLFLFGTPNLDIKDKINL